PIRAPTSSPLIGRPADTLLSDPRPLPTNLAGRGKDTFGDTHSGTHIRGHTFGDTHSGTHIRGRHAACTAVHDADRPGAPRARHRPAARARLRSAPRAPRPGPRPRPA